MTEVLDAALDWFGKRWHTGVCGGAVAAQAIGMNQNTLKTRVNRGQAMALKSPAGEVRSTIDFTGYHLIYNLLQDRFARYNIPIDGLHGGAEHQLYSYAEWAKDHVLYGEKFRDAMLRAWVDTDGQTQISLYEDGNVEPYTGDAALIIPIGTMVVRVAVALFMKEAEAAEFMMAMRSAN